MTKTKKSRASQKLLLNNVSVHQTQRKIPISSQSVKRLLLFMLEHFRLNGTAVFAYFVGEKRISALHKMYFDDSSPTDCITICYDRPGPACHFLGEMFICPKVAFEYVKTSEDDLYKEITLYVVHCFLHLMGFKDDSESKRKKMRAEEKKVMQILEKNKLSVIHK